MAANPLRGEVEVAGPGGPVRLHFSTNALCVLESEMEMGVAEIGELLSDPKSFRIAHARRFIWAAMLDGKPEATLDDAGKLMDAAGIVPLMRAPAETLFPR